MVVKEERCRSGRKRGAQCRKRCIACGVRRNRVGSEADRGHAARKAVGAIHEVVEVRNPGHREDQQRHLHRVHRRKQVPDDHAGGREMRAEAHQSAGDARRRRTKRQPGRAPARR